MDVSHGPRGGLQLPEVFSRVGNVGKRGNFCASRPSAPQVVHEACYWHSRDYNRTYDRTVMLPPLLDVLEMPNEQLMLLV